MIGTLGMQGAEWKRLLEELDLVIADIVPDAPVRHEIVGIRTAVQKAYDDARRSRELRKKFDANSRRLALG